MSRLSNFVRSIYKTQKNEALCLSGKEAEQFISERATNPANELEKFYFNHAGRSAAKWPHYLSIYDKHLSRFRQTKVRFLEIGVFDGGSLQVWRKYFGPDAIIFGIDIDPRCAAFDDKDARVVIGDQSDGRLLEKVISEMGGVDVVIDDGSHIPKHQNASFKYLFPLLSEGGIYICEDLHTSYWSGWKGGLRRPNTFIETVKTIIDHMHGWYTDVSSDFDSLDLKTNILGMSIYDSTVVIEKGHKSPPINVSIPDRTPSQPSAAK